MRIFRYDEVDSTNERALIEVAEGRARDGDVHVARRQTRGRGRRGRRWESAEDEGLYLSYVHLPAPPGPRAEGMTMAAGLAVLEALRALGAPAAGLKWPNDVVLEGAKLAGILVEARGLCSERPHFVVGVGINVRQREFPPSLLRERPVTSLALCGAESDPRRVEERLLEALPTLLTRARTHARDNARDFLRAAGLQGASVRVRTHEGELEGIVDDIDAAMQLALRCQGALERLPLAHIREIQPLNAG